MKRVLKKGATQDIIYIIHSVLKIRTSSVTN